MGRLDQERRCVNSTCADISRTFDLAGRLDRLRLRSGAGPIPAMLSLRYEYDEAGLLRAVPGFLPRVYHDAAGRTTALRFANDILETRRYHPQRGWTERTAINWLGPRPVGYFV